MFVITTLIAAVYVPAAAQENAQKQRPTVGLVLSGGGARGFAHIGVLRVLEENRIPVDYIGGASMGALVGAMYSLGYSPDEMEALVGRLKWDELMQPTTPVSRVPEKTRRRLEPATGELPGMDSNHD